ncbi:DnaJ subfamily B protein [Thraustotheca clavata]|uniref:DnaJ subfamily B protein n=1 Tax=Thraustotheca clavata TaxID=74557 RepID=A0A1W0A4R7_9STRA|nr:DnaJ subfamily B protein [Thraustotheca clavata]
MILLSSKDHLFHHFHSYRAEALKARAEQSMAGSASPRPSNPTSTASTSSTSSSTAAEDNRPFTDEQVKIVQAIKACKNHYDVLGVAKTADENEIKKAYRKLALKLHPDKNSAPGAEDAFKAVGKAFTVLSDDQKRADYDRYGDNAPSENGGQAPRAYRYQQEDISPEEIFNMFFGGGLHPQRHRHRQSHAQHNATPRTPMQQLVQFLPLILVFCLSLISFPAERNVPFSLHPTNEFPVQRNTRMRNVINGIPYYVAKDFDKKYTNDWRDLMRVEQMVQQWHVASLQEGCEAERIKQKRRINKARGLQDVSTREDALRKAASMAMPNCDELQRLSNFTNQNHFSIDMAEVVTEEELTALVQAIKFAHPDYTLKQVHTQINTHGGKYTSVPLARVKKYLKKLGLNGSLRSADEPVALMTIGGESKSIPSAAPSEERSEEWVPMELDVAMMQMEKAPHQAVIRMNASTVGAASGALGEIYKIQKAMGDGEQHPMLVYNKDRSRKTFLHPPSDTYSRASDAIDKAGQTGVGGGTKAYFYGRVQGKTLFVNVQTLAEFQQW